MKQLNYITLLSGLLLFKLVQANEEEVELPITSANNNNFQTATAASSSLLSTEGSRRHRLTVHRKSRRRQLLVESLRSNTEDEFNGDEELEEDEEVDGERLLQKKNKKKNKKTGRNNKNKRRKNPNNNNVNNKKKEKKKKIVSDIKKERKKKIKKPGTNKQKKDDDDDAKNNDPGWCLCEDLHRDYGWNGDYYDDDWSNDVGSSSTSKRKKYKNTRNKKRKDGRFLLELAAEGDEDEEEFHAVAVADSEDDVDSWRHLRSDELLEEEEEEEEDEGDDDANEEERDTASLADIFSAAEEAEEEEEEGESVMTLSRFKKRQNGKYNNNKKKVDKRNNGGRDKWRSSNRGQQGSWGGHDDDDDDWGGDEWGSDEWGGGQREKPKWCPCPVVPVDTDPPTYPPTYITIPPTLSPSLSPTVSPTMYPTLDPTRSPSMEPTVHPTPRPTKQPTNPPTRMPTPRPTPKPIPGPTPKPSPAPTQSPTPVPSKRPTRSFPYDGFNWGEKAAVGGPLGQTQPIPARFNNGIPIGDITAGRRYTLYLDVDGNAFASGYVESLSSYEGQFGVGFGVNLGSNYDRKVNSVFRNGAVEEAPSFQSVHAGSDHSAFIDKDGQVYITGSNSNGKLCLDDGSSMKNFPHLVKLPPNRMAVTVALGLQFTLILLDNGQVYGCGSNILGQLGLGDTASVSKPTRIGESLGRIKAVSAGGEFSLYLTEAGKAYSSGNNLFKQQCRNTNGNPIKTPTEIINPGLSVLAIQGGSSSSYLLLTDGGNSPGVASCGRNNEGQLCGQPANTNGRAKVELGSTIKATGIGSGPTAETVFFTGMDITNGRDVVYGCGRNDLDQVGIGSNQPSRISTPKRVSFLGSKRFRLKISASTFHSVAIASGAVIPSDSDAPSSSPSLPPTTSVSPTKAPSFRPTKSPTVPPQTPTNPPTNAPTKAPTNAPTKVPTSPPTAPPTDTSGPPTNQPTKAPTKAPAPTSPPTASPTVTPGNPTKSPTNPPTSPPTNAPTKAPTPFPTNPPTPSPTNPPTSPPTNAPTKAPTPFPTNPLTPSPTNPSTPSPTQEPVARITAIDDLTPTPTGSSDNFRFGRSVAISGTSALVGAPNAEDNDENVSGAVYLFEDFTDNTQTKYLSKLDAPPPTPSNVRFRCGHSVALSEKYIVIGCPGFKDFEDGVYSGNEIGAVSIYPRGFTFPNKITYQVDVDAQFGTSVSINSAGIVAVGTRRGFVELYDQEGDGQPNLPFLMLGADLNFDELNDNFGWSVALNDDNWLAVGAIKQDGGNGSVFLWRNLNNDPEEIPAPAAAKDQCGSLVDGDFVEGDCEFGYSVAFSGKTLVVGSPSTRVKAGRAYVYDLTLDDYKSEVQSLPANPPPGSEFGFSVAIKDGAVVVGSRKYSVNGVARGAAYFYNKDKNGKWYLPKFDNNIQNPIVGKSEGDRFGTAVAINDKAFVVGAPYRSDRKGEVVTYSYESATNPSSIGAAAEGEESSNRSPPGRSSNLAEVVKLEISDDCTLAYRVNDLDTSTTLTITMELVCEGVDKWIGIGFSSDGLMQNSEAVLGIPGNDRPLRYALNGKTVDTVVRMPDQEQILIGANLQVFNNATTAMTFTKALENEAGEEIFLLFARGATSSLGYHAERSSVKITL